MRKILLLLLVATYLSGCFKKEEQVITTRVEQYRPETSSVEVIQQQQQETMYEEQTTAAMLPSPDMYETQPVQQNIGNDNLGSLNFSNMPTNAKLTTEATTVEESTSIDSYTNVSEEYTRQNSLLETTTEVETTTEAETTVEETTVEETEEPKAYDLIAVEPNDRTGEPTNTTRQYSKNADVVYKTRDNPSYKRKLEVPDVLGYGKDAYNNYIINDELFVSGQTKLPKFSAYGYKIPYLYWYDKDKNLLNPLPSTYARYSTLFYTADDEVIDPYKVEETKAEESSASTEETSVVVPETTSSEVEVASIDDLDIKTNKDTEKKFMEHAAYIGERYATNKKRSDYETKIKENVEWMLDSLEIEYAISIGLGGYYENKIGPGYQEAEGEDTTSKFYTFTDRTTGKVYQLTILQVKQLIGSGKWRELNKEVAAERMK